MAAGFCPTCEAPGTVGTPCLERVCRKAGSHFIPEPEFAKVRGKPPAGRNPMIGQLVGDYLIVDIVGEGGFGKVFLGLQVPILLKAALKVMSIEGVDADTAAVMTRKFEGEAQALATLNHPNIVRLLKYGVWRDQPYLVMEYVENGRTLKKEMTDRVLRGEAIDPDAVPSILRQALNALDAAHAKAIVHRDIKPENIMLQEVAGDPRFVRVLDFGLAKFVEERTETSLAMGTPTYMAPEQVMRRHLGPWTDLYALCVIAFELITGRRPYEGRTIQEVISRKLDPAYDPTSTLSGLPVGPEVRDFFRRGLARDPENRYRSATEFRAALERIFAVPGGARAVVVTPDRRAVPPELPVTTPEIVRKPVESDAPTEALPESVVMPSGPESPPSLPATSMPPATLLLEPERTPLKSLESAPPQPPFPLPPPVEPRPVALSPARRGMSAGAIVAIVLVGVFLVLAVLSLIAVPAYLNYMRRAKTAEAIDSLDKIARGASYYYSAPHVSSDGRKLDCRFPESVGLTPAKTCCFEKPGSGDKDGDDRCDPVAGAWDAPTWNAMMFEMNDPHYYLYSFDSNGKTLQSAMATASAHADLDCDGTMSTFRRFLTGAQAATPAECAIGASALFGDHETE